ncbi:TPA: multidrug ABC transporter ATP-binding protein [Candidatus Acetothermia bacterium]|nr:multidrug ABC transporter ATP-binding protein [Candidatus Acetothermia bacterium]
MRSLVRIFRFVRPYRLYAAGALTLLLGMVGADLLIPRLIQRIIDDGIAAGDMGVIATTALAMIGAAVVSTLFAIANTTLSVRVGQGFGHDVRSALVRKIQTLSFANLDRLQTGQLLVRTTSDVHMVEMIVGMSLRILTRAPVWVAGSIILLVLTSRDLAWLLAAIVPVIVVIVFVFLRRAGVMFLGVQKQLDRLNTVLQENLAGVRVVKAFGREGHEAGRFDRENEGLMRKNIEVMTFFAVLVPTMMLLVNLGVVGAIWLGGQAAIGGTLTVGQVVAAINYLTFALFPMMLIAGMMGPLSAAEASASRILEVLDTAPDVREQPKLAAFPSSRSSRGVRVEFESVTFAYDGDGGAPVLQGVNLVAEPGETVAILGATGSGKSTLIHLIPRFYDVTAGRVIVDGADVRDLPLAVLRREIGIALQEAVLFTGTVLDNIRYGRREASEAEVVAAAQAAQAHDFIVELPQGYDTVVGERGVNLSGGQRQRIAIARALLVRPRLLILDDSTSAVDIETEVKLQDALDRLMAKDHSCTRLIVAQRISTVLLADKIVVLDGGRVAALGTHERLMRDSPVYRDIYASQLGNGEDRHGT